MWQNESQRGGKKHSFTQQKLHNKKLIGRWDRRDLQKDIDWNLITNMPIKSKTLTYIIVISERKENKEKATNQNKSLSLSLRYKKQNYNS